MNPFQALWDAVQRMGTPIPVDQVSTSDALAPPRLQEDEFPFTHQQIKRTQIQEQRVHELHRRVIETNNACVERGMGHYTELVAHHPNVRLLSPMEQAEIAAYELGIVFVDAPHVP